MKKIILLCNLLFISIFAFASMRAQDRGLTPLMNACRSGDLPLVKKLIKAGADVNASSKYYHRTALMYAVKDNMQPAPIVEYLLKNGAKIESKDIYINTELLNCLLIFPRIYGKNKKQRTASLRESAWLILKAGAKVKVCNDQGETPLIAASGWMDSDFIAELLKRGANIEAHANHSGETSLIRALQHNNMEVVKLLLDHGAKPNVRNYSNTVAIFFAKNLAAVKLLLENGAVLDCGQITSSRRSRDAFKVLKSVSVMDNWARWAGPKLIKLALDKHCPVTVKALTGAAKNSRHPEVLSLLLKHYKSSEKLPLGIMLNKAAQVANASGVKLLLEQGANPNSTGSYGRTTLINACLNANFPVKRYEIVKLLLKQGANPNIADKQGKTALIWLMWRVGSVDIAKALITHGAKVDTKDKQSRTALLTLMANPYHRNTKTLPLLELLLKYNANLNEKDKNGASLLLLALGHQQLASFIKHLIKLNVPVNTASKDGVTPLMLAARHYDVEIVKLLLERGAKVNVSDDTGWTALMYAAEYWPVPSGCIMYPVPYRRNRKAPQKTIKLLIQHGAKANVSDEYGNTSLIEAAGWADADTLKLLIKHGRSLFFSFVNAQNARGRSALMCAVVNNPDDKAVKALIAAGAKCEVRMNEGKYPSRNKRKIADGLVSSLKKSYGWLDPPLFVAVARGKKNIVKAMLESGADPNWQYSGRGSNLYKPLRECKDTEIAALLMKAGAKNSSQNISPTDKVNYQKFWESCRNENPVVLKKMLKALKLQNTEKRKQRLKNNIKSLKSQKTEIQEQLLNKALRYAIASNNLKVVKWLLKQGAHLSSSDIINAARNADNPDVLSYLLKHGLTTKYRVGYPVGKHYRGKGALHFASSAEIVDILVKNGMDVNKRDDRSMWGLTPLQEAISRNWYKDSWRREELIEALIQHGAKLEKTDYYGKTALLTAFNRQYSSPSITVVKILLKHGANVNAKDKQGCTALNLSVKKRNCYLTDILLTAGADPSLVKKEDMNKNLPYISWRINKALLKQKEKNSAAK